MQFDGSLDSVISEDVAPLIDVGADCDRPIRELAEAVARVVGFEGRLKLDTSKPNGTGELLDSTKMRSYGWAPKASLEEEIRRVSEGVEERLASELVSC
jgi:GDP-L-fucose synthase